MQCIGLLAGQKPRLRICFLLARGGKILLFRGGWGWGIVYQTDILINLTQKCCFQAFEAMCFEGNDVPEKRKRDQFKKLVSGIVGVRIKLQFDSSLHHLLLCQMKIWFSSQSDISKGTIKLTEFVFIQHCYHAYYAFKSNLMVISIGFPNFLLIRVVIATCT